MANSEEQTDFSSLLEIDGTPIFPTATSTTDDGIFDRDWAKNAFMVTDEDIGNTTDIVNRYWTSASAKFVDGRLGCNIGINPRPQWTRYADIRVKGRFRNNRATVSVGNTAGNYGMGRAYSEGIDDPAQKIFMRFGVPRFNSLFDFLTRAFDREMTIMARTGRAPTAWYTISKTIGTLITFSSFPFLTVTVEAGRAVTWLMGKSTSKFFTLKPTMHNYWSMVNLLVNNHAANTGIFPRVFKSNTNSHKLGNTPYKLDEEQMKDIAALMPDVFHGADYFDCYAIANKAQRMANELFEIDYKHLNEGSASDFEGYLQRDDTGNGRHSSYISTDKNKPTFGAWLNQILTFGDYYIAPDDIEKASQLQQEMHPAAAQKDGNGGTKPGDEAARNKFANHADAEWREGSQFAVFRVDYTGSVSESFGNSTAESELSQKLNGISSEYREKRFSLADGNIIGGIFTDIQNAATDVIMGALDGVTLGFAGLVPGLGGSGYLDIPKHWQSSSASLPRGQYTIQLISQYNNPISRMINIWIPFYMILAGAIPRSTGKQSYTSPFYCQLYDRGRLQSRLAMIESLSINRGTSNLGFDLHGNALAIDLSFTVVDLSTIMHMPMSSGGLLETDITMDDDNIANDWFAVLAGMDIYSQIYPLPGAQLKLRKQLMKIQQKFSSPAFHASLFRNSVEDGMINDLSLGLSGLVSNLYTAGVRGTAVSYSD